MFRSALFHLRAGAIAFNFAGLFLYIAAAPTFVTEHLKLGQDQFGWLFIPSVSGIFLGSMALAAVLEQEQHLHLAERASELGHHAEELGRGAAYEVGPQGSESLRKCLRSRNLCLHACKYCTRGPKLDPRGPTSRRRSRSG